MKNICDAIHDGHDKLRMLSHRLATLAYHFEEVGNEKVGRTLRDINEEMREAADGMLKAWSNDLNEQVHAQWDGIGNTIKTICEMTQTREKGVT